MGRFTRIDQDLVAFRKLQTATNNALGLVVANG